MMINQLKRVLDANVEKLKKLFEDNKDIIAVYIFGSYAKEQMNALSDIDIGILFEHGVDYSSRQLDLLSEIMLILDTDKVDLVVLNSAPLIIQYRVITEGKILYCKDKKKKDDYEMKSINLFLDFKPFVEEYSNILLEKIKSGGFSA